VARAGGRGNRKEHCRAAGEAFPSQTSSGHSHGRARGNVGQVDPAQLRKTPALGLMVVTEDNHAGGAQAKLLPVRFDD
jgi:hypothetical protein